MKGYSLLAGFIICSVLSSCFKEEPLNAECDITQVSVHLDNPTGTFFNVTDTLKTVSPSDSVIVFNVRRNHDADLTTLKPKFEYTEGATVTQISEPVQRGQEVVSTYRVTSEDKMWHRNYTLVFSPITRTVSDTVKYDFEHYALEQKEQKYYVWYEQQSDGTPSFDWANGNPGFRLSMGSATPDQYPSAPLIHGYEGNAIKLVTRSTGMFGKLARKPIAAGSFFLGKFDLAQALQHPMLATQFGIPFDREPIEMTGYYKYIPGRTYQDRNGKPVGGRQDSAAIYAVFYLNHDAEGKAITLHGDNVKTSPQVVAIADLGKVSGEENWTEFKLPFNYTSKIDYSVLANRGYSLAIVFSSSDEGDHFEGAIDSELCIDKVRIVCKKEE